jgi:microcystin-dependent protein
MLARLFDALRRLFRIFGVGEKPDHPTRRGSVPPHLSESAVGRPGPTPSPPPPPPTPPSPPAEGVLALSQLIATAGEFPVRTGESATGFTLGMVQSFAGRDGVFGAPPADGRELPVSGNQPLMAVIGLSFGGDGVKLALPDLRGRTPVGGQQIGMEGAQTLALTYLIASTAASGAPVLGMIVAFGGNFAPAGWALANGSMLPISANVALYQAIGQTFGGNPVAFNLPDLDGFAVIGAGQGPGLQPIALGGRVASPVPALALNYLINVEGATPPPSGSGGFPQYGGWLGQVIAFAGSEAPDGLGAVRRRAARSGPESGTLPADRHDLWRRWQGELRAARSARADPRRRLTCPISGRRRSSAAGPKRA